MFAADLCGKPRFPVFNLEAYYGNESQGPQPVLQHRSLASASVLATLTQILVPVTPEKPL